MPRLRYLRRWAASARSSIQEATFEQWVWAGVSIGGLVLKQLREWGPAVYFMSSWALFQAASIKKSEAKRELLEEQAEES